MKKLFNHTVVSAKVKCVECGKPIKSRLVALKQPHNRRKCYKCYAAVRYGNALLINHTDSIDRRCITSHRTACKA